MNFQIFLSVAFLLINTENALAEFIPKKVATAVFNSCAVSVDGRLKCWGENLEGQLGLGTREFNAGLDPGSMGKNLPSVDLGKDVKVSDVCLGYHFTCALTTDAKIKCWGAANSIGQAKNLTHSVGLDPNDMGDALPYTDLGGEFRAIALSCGESHACALNDAGRAKCWGSNSSGQLGIENTQSNIGLLQGEMGDNLPFVIESQKILAISLGDSFSCALLADHSFKCWGNNSSGSLGIESKENHGQIKSSMDSALPAVKLEYEPYYGVSISAGYTSACAIYKFKGKQKVKCWGDNRVGQLGIGTATSEFGTTAGSMGDHLPEVNVGFNIATDLQVYGGYACGLSSEHKLKCWGYNDDGRLGQGNTELKGLDPKTMGSNLPYSDLGLPVKVLGVGAFTEHTCAILINNSIKCWGFNSDGQLGIEDGGTRGVKPDDMGDSLPFVHLDPKS